VTFHKRNRDGRHEKCPLKTVLHKDGKPLWKKHPFADVAVIEITPPAEALFPSIPVASLATDDDLVRFRVHPGDPIRCLGFPHAKQFQPSEAGFGVIRAGCIASYPLLPTRKTRSFLVDLNTFEGDSGAPIYLVDDRRVVQGKSDPQPAKLILGVMVGQHFLDEEFKMIYQAGKFRHRMGFGIVIHATVIQETIDLLVSAG
jgi:hypothetical protein